MPKRVHPTLRIEEIPRVLEHVPPLWRPFTATAIYAGLRKGELCGLRKCDVDLDAGLITVRRSYERETTKGGHADVIPIAPALAPFLQAAIDGSCLRHRASRGMRAGSRSPRPRARQGQGSGDRR